MIGMDANTGEAIAGLERLKQSVRDILTTPIGTRVMSRDYGSRVPYLIDQPINRQTQIEIFAATAQALRRWEPRLNVDRVRMPEAGRGWVVVELEARFAHNGEPVALDGVVVP